MESREKQQAVAPKHESSHNESSIGRLVRFCAFEVPTVLVAWTILFQWFLHSLHSWLVAGEYAYAIQIESVANALQMLFTDALCKATIPRLLKLQDSLSTTEFDAALA